MVHTKTNFSICRLLALVLFFACVIIFSAIRCASFAFGHVVDMLSCWMREVTRLRRRARRWEDLRERWRYVDRAPAMVVYG